MICNTSKNFKITTELKFFVVLDDIVVSSNVNMDGGSGNTVLSVFAPAAQVQLTAGVSVEGSIISESFIITGGSHVKYNENIFFPDPLT